MRTKKLLISFGNLDITLLLMVILNIPFLEKNVLLLIKYCSVIIISLELPDKLVLPNGRKFFSGNSVYPITVCQEKTTWQSVGNSTDWTDAANWTNGVLGKKTKVTISTSTSYPVLTDSITIRNIYFEHGTEIGRQDLLIHEKAFIDYDFGTGNRSDYFRMLSIPLMETYPRDFTFGGGPDW